MIYRQQVGCCFSQMRIQEETVSLNPCSSFWEDAKQSRSDGSLIYQYYKMDAQALLIGRRLCVL